MISLAVSQKPQISASFEGSTPLHQIAKGWR
jgi:hypothetical protein